MKPYINRLLFAIFIQLAILLFSSSVYADWPAPQPEDFSNLSWPDAFDALNNKLAKEYAFSEWKGIDWNKLSVQFKPIIAKAYQQKPKDVATYNQAMRNYLQSIHDGHIILNISKENIEFYREQIKQHNGGSYGLILTQSNLAWPQNKVYVSYVAANSEAANAGIKPGMEVLNWNGVPINLAIGNTLTTWATMFSMLNGESHCIDNLCWILHNPATLDGINYEKIRQLARNKIGNTITITFKEIKYPVLLTAFDDHGDLLKRTDLWKEQPWLTSEILPSGYGYIKLAAEDRNVSDKFAQFKTVMQNLHNVPGIILDLRGNLGGDGSVFSEQVAGFFTQHSLFNFDVMMYDAITDKYAFYQHFGCDPQTPNYSGPVIVLTDLGTISAGEILANLLSELPQVHIMSFYNNTQGSLAGNALMVLLPEKLIVPYAYFRLVDQQGKIIGDSDKNLAGGVKTEIKVPIDAATAVAIYTNNQDILLQHAEDCLRKQCWNISNNTNYSKSNATASTTKAGSSIMTGTMFYEIH